ncbi:Predicted DNA-binding protein, contains XRE-type HTH domain [Bryocella elongata]|uniref:Predicted DNA-binding protein, contains XRE-type HTH domain n=1 Tax=Bryocella elongata TaxID=863522 RepID=A0A1H5XP45_9BACT|nr:helix-turn-helix transcriptional regulator [Bryocella elongata]SEG13403.1 Predicted DNA-binding protein, contains XRE-type HTH domain [Bryocella elongata]
MIEEFNSVWDALGFSTEEGANLEARASLMRELREIIRSRSWTQAVAAKQCRVSQPRLNDLMRGRIDKFSIDALVNMAASLGLRVSFELTAA